MTEVERERSRLTRLAYRMLGSWSDAEDIVQQSYERWYRLEDDERAAIERPSAWFTTVASRLCLNLLSSAPKRRERYVGPWLPEPIPAHMPPAPDPLDQVTLDDSVSMALLVALEALTPVERVSYILHEVFGLRYAEIADITGRTSAATRQAASSARRRLRHGAGTRQVSTAEHTRIVDAFEEACLSGNLDALIAVLDPNVVSVSDGNGAVGVAKRPIVGAQNVAQFLLGILLHQAAGTRIDRVYVNGTPGFALLDVSDNHGPVVIGVVSFFVQANKIQNIWFTMNPGKLKKWNPIT